MEMKKTSVIKGELLNVFSAEESAEILGSVATKYNNQFSLDQPVKRCQSLSGKLLIPFKKNF